MRSPACLHDNARLAAIGWATTATLAAFLCFTQLGMMLALLAGRVGTSLVAPAALVLAVVVGDRLARGALLTGRDRFAPPLLALSTLGGALAAAAWYFDLSWDGQWYHQTAVYAIARDWNPLTDPMRGFLEHLQLWVRHYAKGPWYVAAAVYDTTGRIELGKFPALVAPAALALATFAAGLDANLRRWEAEALALVVAMNPVVMSELPTYLVDGIMIGFLGVAVAALFSALRQPRPLVVGTGLLAAIVSINAKFTGLVFLCFAFAASWLWCLACRRAWLVRFTALAALTLVLGAGVLGYNPYVTNTIYRHQPFYPVLGSAAYPSLTAQGREGIIRYETPKNFLVHNRVVRLGYATFGRPGNAPYAGVRDATLMVPFASRPGDWAAYRYHETRVAGFGPYFSGAFLMALGLGGWLVWQRTPARGPALLAVAAIAGSLLISPHLWWPRYGPQLWLLPIVPVAFVFAVARARTARAAAWLVLALLVANAAIVTAVRMRWETRATTTLRRQLTTLEGRTIAVSLRWFEIPVGERLRTWNVSFQPRTAKELPTGTELMSVVEGYPGAVVYRVLPPATAATAPRSGR